MGHRQKCKETAAFPSLHSNGLATVYDDTRKVRVAPAEAKRHLLSLSLRTFAQHPLWQIAHFDNEEKDRSQGLTTVRLARDSQIAESAVQVTEKERRAANFHTRTYATSNLAIFAQEMAAKCLRLAHL